MVIERSGGGGFPAKAAVVESGDDFHILDESTSGGFPRVRMPHQEIINRG